MMLYDYVAVAFFSTAAILAPVLLLLFSRSVRKKLEANAVKNAPYESGEETSGKSMDADVGYLPFAMLFLPFELVCIIMLLWARTAVQNSLQQNLIVLGFLAVSTILAIVCYALISENHE